MAPSSHNHSRSGRPPSSRLIFEETLPSDTTLIEDAVERALLAVRSHGAADGTLDAVDLALREALVNAMVHGNRRDLAKNVQVQCFAHEEGSLLLVIRDEGVGFDPSQVVDPTLPENLERPTGRGIHLIRQFMDAVDFLEGGREIRMQKKKQ